ncbi:MAG: aldehyde dehydrogenase family protein [Ferruginibacter sp.]
MQPKLKIGLTYTGTEEKHRNYINWLKGNDNIDVIKLCAGEKNADFVKELDAVVISGGLDIHPKNYNGNAVYPNAPGAFNESRDAFEIQIFHLARQQRIPVLGICRGLQLINCILGGDLKQDLGETGNAIHRNEGIDKKHAASILPGTLLNVIANTEQAEINSAHHQCVNKLADGLKVNAVSADGVIEGYEWAEKDDKPFFLCVQWHPERMYQLQLQSSPLSKNIRDYFITEIYKAKTSRMVIINPATEEIITTVNEDDAATIQQKFEQAKQAQQEWRKLDVTARISIFEKFYMLLDEHKDELAATLTSEVGKPIQQSYNEINGARARIKFFIDNTAKWLAEEWVTTEGSTKEKIVYEPLGVIANISAWNYPYLVGVNVFIPALLGGNAVLYKPSEYSTLTGLHIQKLLYAAGIPENCFRLIIGKGNVGECLLQLPLNGYFFTGSYKTGKYIAERVASKLVPCQLELGGKDPLYVMDDVEDINKTAAAVLEGVVYNSGQSCCAVERVYVHEKVFDVFVDSYVQQCKQLKIGDPADKSTDIGPLTRKEQQLVLTAQINDAVEKGATILCGGKIPGQKGFYIEPTVLINVNHEMQLMKDESFGPVTGIQKVKDDTEAVLLMLDTEYGLTAAVYSKDLKRAEAVMHQMNTGTVYWNCCDRVSAALPWSGRNHSGLGSTLSYQGIRAFVQPKAYHIRG